MVKEVSNFTIRPSYDGARATFLQNGHGQTVCLLEKDKLYHITVTEIEPVYEYRYAFRLKETQNYSLSTDWYIPNEAVIACGHDLYCLVNTKRERS